MRVPRPGLRNRVEWVLFDARKKNKNKNEAKAKMTYESRSNHNSQPRATIHANKALSKTHIKQILVQRQLQRKLLEFGEEEMTREKWHPSDMLFIWLLSAWRAPRSFIKTEQDLIRSTPTSNTMQQNNEKFKFRQCRPPPPRIHFKNTYPPFTRLYSSIVSSACLARLDSVSRRGRAYRAIARKWEIQTDISR